MDDIFTFRRYLLTQSEMNVDLEQLIKHLVRDGRGEQLISIVKDIAIKGNLAKTSLISGVLAVCTSVSDAGSNDWYMILWLTYSRFQLICLRFSS